MKALQPIVSIHLAPVQREELRSQPESGMGYQLVEVQLNGRWESGVVFNGQYLISGEDVEKCVVGLKATAALGSSVQINQPIPLRLVAATSPLAASASTPAVMSARQATEEQTSDGEGFIRFSAYEDDIRVTAGRGLAAGTYATTLADAEECLKSGSTPVARYALPNDLPANWAFRITPLAQTPVQRGMAEPANGQPGGGVEVIFPKGTADCTVSHPKNVSDGILP